MSAVMNKGNEVGEGEVLCYRPSQSLECAHMQCLSQRKEGIWHISHTDWSTPPSSLSFRQSNMGG